MTARIAALFPGATQIVWLAEASPDLIIIQRFGPLSFTSGAEFSTLIKRPSLTVSDARAIEEQAPSIQLVDIQLGVGGAPPNQERVFYRNLRTKMLIVFGTTENFAEGTQLALVAGRFFTGTEVQHRSRIVVLGQLVPRRRSATVMRCTRFVPTG